MLARQAEGKLRFLDVSHVKVHQDGSNPAGGQQNQAMERTKGGLNTKISAWVDGRGQAVSLSLAPEQHADVSVVQAAARPKLRGTITVADKGCASDGFRAQLRCWGEPRLHSAAPKPTQEYKLASGSLPKTAPGGKLVPKVETP